MVVVDATGKQSYIRVPPDSTGKRSGTTKILAVEYGSGTTAFSIGDIVVGASSGTHGRIIKVQGTTSSGTIYVSLHDDSTSINFTTSENLQVSAVTYAVVTSEAEIHYTAAVTVGGENPFNVQQVSSLGSARVRFAEGEQLIDAFGVTRHSESFLVDQILFHYNANSLRFYDNVSGSGASLTHLSESVSVALDVGTGNNEICQRTTHVYFPYTPGFGSLTEMTVLCGDSGKDGVIRRWGRFDDNDGLFFEHSGSTFNVVQRSSATGTVVDTKISQSAFNVDSMDGTGASEHAHVLDKLALYWIDYAWLGAGQARLGVYSPDGTRIVAHKFQNSETSVVPYMARGNLPFRVEIKNEAVTASPSRLTLTCVSIKTDGFEFRPDAKFGNTFSKMTDASVSVDPNNWVPLLTWRGTDIISGTSIANHYLSVPSSIAGYTTSPVALRLYNFAVVNTSSWNAYGTSGLQFSASGSSVLGGNVANSWFVEASSSFTHDVSDFFDFATVASSQADGTPGRVWVLAAQSLEPGVTSSVRARMTWTDIE